MNAVRTCDGSPASVQATTRRWFKRIANPQGATASAMAFNATVCSWPI
jgi:hypothetical protein